MLPRLWDLAGTSVCSRCWLSGAKAMSCIRIPDKTDPDEDRRTTLWMNDGHGTALPNFPSCCGKEKGWDGTYRGHCSLCVCVCACCIAQQGDETAEAEGLMGFHGNVTISCRLESGEACRRKDCEWPVAAAMGESSHWRGRRLLHWEVWKGEKEEALGRLPTDYRTSAELVQPLVCRYVACLPCSPLVKFLARLSLAHLYIPPSLRQQHLHPVHLFTSAFIFPPSSIISLAFHLLANRLMVD